MVPLGGHKGDPCLMHPGAPHDMETCSAVEELLQWMIDQGWLEIDNENEKEQHICMQSAYKESPKKPKPLVMNFTRGAAPQNHRGPSMLSGSKLVSICHRDWGKLRKLLHRRVSSHVEIHAWMGIIGRTRLCQSRSLSGGPL